MFTSLYSLLLKSWTQVILTLTIHIPYGLQPPEGQGLFCITSADSLNNIIEHKLFNTKIIKLKIKSVGDSSQGSYTVQLDFCNWLAVRQDNVICITLRQV